MIPVAAFVAVSVIKIRNMILTETTHAISTATDRSHHGHNAVSPGISVCPSVLSSVHLSIFQSAIPLLYDALVEFYLCATNVESILARKCRFGTKNDQNRKSNAPTASRVAAHHANDSDEAYRCSHGGCVAQGCDPYPSPATRKGKDPPVCRQQR